VDNPVNDDQPVYAGCTEALLRQYLHPQDSWYVMTRYSTRSGIVGSCGWVNSLTPDFSSPLTWSSPESGIKLHALSALSLRHHRLGKQVLPTPLYRKYPLSSDVRRRSRLCCLLVSSDNSSQTVNIASAKRLHVTFRLHLGSLTCRTIHGARSLPKLPLGMYPGRCCGQFLHSLQHADQYSRLSLYVRYSHRVDQIWTIAKLPRYYMLFPHRQSHRSQELCSKVLAYQVLSKMISILWVFTNKQHNKHTVLMYSQFVSTKWRYR